MLAECTYSRFPFLLLVSRVWEISSGIGPCFPLAGGLCKFYANAGGKRPIQATTTPTASSKPNYFSRNNYIPLAISWNDKNKQLTLLNVNSREIPFLHCTVIEAPKKK
jgi:hypothetical protein